MAFNLVVLLCALAYANAGGLVAPVAYSPASSVSHSYISQAAAPVATYAHAAPVATYAHAAPIATYAQPASVAIHAPAVGATSQSVVRSLGGNQAVSHYSKAVDSAFSSVRKYDTRITNDALSYAHAPVATYAHAAPVAHAAYAAPVATYAHAAPVATYAHAAPVATYAHAAPVATYAHAAPVATYAHAAAPVVAKAAVSYSPAAVVAHTTFTGLGAHYEW